MAMGVMLAPVGCSIGADEEPQPVTGVPKAIAGTVDQLERAVAQRDYAKVCNKLYTATARERAGGDECASQTRSAAEGVRRPRIKIEGIEVKGERATVKVATTAEGQARVTNTLELRHTGRGWLVEAVS
jgi:hypothetical protein